MRSIIPFEIEYDKEDNTLALIQSEDVTYVYTMSQIWNESTSGIHYGYLHFQNSVKDFWQLIKTEASQRRTYR